MEKNIPGKLRLEAHIALMPIETKINAEVYIHLRGYARARVSHLDVEKWVWERLFVEDGAIFLR